MDSDNAQINAVKALQLHLESILPSLSSEKRFIHSSILHAHAQHDMDEAIHGVEAAFHQVLAALRRERNSMSPISSLPPEVLANVFSYGSLAETLSASWVSRAWRMAAISAPSLWTCFDLDAYQSAELRELQLRRCGTLPLHLNLRIVKDPAQNLKPQIQDRHLLSVAQSISRLVDPTILVDVDLSKLKSLHLYSDTDGLRHSSIETVVPNLHHLCIDMLDREFSGVFHGLPMRMKSLETLHLHIQTTTADGILKQITNLPRLRELLIQWIPGASDDEVTSLDPHEILVDEQHPLRQIHLIDTPYAFLKIFLDHISPSRHTNVDIFSLPLSSNDILGQLRRQTPTITVWMDQQTKTFLYDHGASITKLVGTESPAKSFCGLPQSVDLSSLTTLIISKGPPPTSKDLRGLINLTTLAFVFEPAPVGETQKPLSETLSDELAGGWPRLQEIIMVLRKPLSTNIVVKDRALETILSFLEAWILEWEVVFPIFRISDKIKPQRWLPQLDILFSLTLAFELQDIDLDRLAPLVPEPRRFIPERPPLPRKPLKQRLGQLYD